MHEILDVRAPAGDRNSQRLANADGSVATTSTTLQPSAAATVTVGATAVRVRFGPDAAVTATTTDPILPAYGRIDWIADAATCFVSVLAADGATAYEAHAWTSSGPRTATSG